MAVRGDFLARQAGFAAQHVTVFCEYACHDIIPAFGNPENRANELAESEYRRLCSQPVGEDGDYDMAIAAEAAHEKGLAFYETLTAVRQSMLNLLAAGLFHLIEQELANLCHIEAETVAPPTDTKICVTANWYLQHFGLDPRSLDSWLTMDDLRLVANTVKHAEGKSAADLRQRRPEFFRHPIDRELFPNETQSVGFVRPVRSPLSGEDLYITEEAFHGFAQAAERFLRDVVNYFEAHDSDYFPR